MLLAKLEGVIRAAATLAVLVALLGASSAQALTLEPVGDFDQPIYVTADPSDAGRLFVAERGGTIQLVEDGDASEFADLSAEVACCVNERGLASIALDPDFDDNGRLYVFYTGEEEPGELHVDELISDDPNHESAAFERNLLTLPHGDFTSHNGGQLQFGPDGDLYLATGDGGGTNDPLDNGQDPSSPLGKLLRIDPDDPNLPNSYEIWSSGLRNPFRFSFDALTGDTVIGDVGQAAREEIDFAPSPFPGIVGGEDANYGWDCREGLLPGVGPSPLCATAPPDAFTEPVFDYPHTPDPDLGGSNRCSVIGGYVVRDPALEALLGRYLYTDLCSGVLRSLQLPASGGSASDDCLLGPRLENPVSFGEDAAHRLYVVEQDGSVYRLLGPQAASCPVVPPSLPPTSEPEAKPPAAPTFVGITAQRRRVERGKAALLTVWVSPCQKRKGEAVALFRNGHRNGSRYLSRACTARFLRRIHRNTTFAGVTYTSSDYLAGVSRPLKIRVERRRLVPR
jgi:hypothetical protein